jgi:WD40 repeat protein
MGVVYKARQVNLNRIVALKMILSGAFAGTQERARFRVEGEAAAQLEHPNIVGIYEVGEHEGRPYCALEHVDGGSLAQRLTGTPQPARVAAQLVETLARAVQYAHDHRIIHRDLKPANVILAGGSDTPLEQCLPKITDFGLAKQLNGGAEKAGAMPAYQTQTGEILGTPSYMAPEQAEGKHREIGPAADIYALGAILYELLTGRPPFKGESPLDTLEQVRSQEPVPPSRLQPRLARDLSTICLKALAKAPGRRYASAGALANDLRRFLDGRPIQARPVGAGEKLWRWCRRNPVVAGLSAAVVLALGAGLAVSIFFAVQATEQGQQARCHLYGAQMHLAQSYWESAHISQVLALLNQHGDPDLRGWEWHYLWRLCHDELHTFEAGDSPGCVALSPDWRLLATESQGRTVQVWETAGRQEVHTFRVPGALSLAFSPDGRWLAVGNRAGRITVWDSTSRQVRHDFAAHSGLVSCVVFSPDGKQLASSSAEDRVIRLWNALDRQELHTLRGHVRPVRSVAFSPDGRRLASASQDQTIKLWDVSTGAALMTLYGHAQDLHQVAFSLDGRQLVSASDDGTAKIWDARQGRELATLRGHAETVTAVAFSPDGRWLVTASSDRTVKLWDAASGQVMRTFRGHRGAVLSVVFSPDGRLVGSVGAGRTVKLWDAGLHREAHPLRGGPVAVFSPDGQLLAAPVSRLIKVWDAASLQVMRVLRGHTADVWGVAFSPDGRWLASGDQKGTIKLWNAASGKEVRTLRGHTGWVFSLGFRRDGQRLASASADGTVRLWDPVRGAELFTLAHESRQAVHSVTFSPDGRLLASASDDRTVKVWDAVAGQELRTLGAHTSWVYSVAFSPDGQRLASASEDQTTKVWDVSRGKVVCDIPPVTMQVTSVAFHPDGRRLVTGSSYGSIKVWDAESGQELLTLQGHTAQVWSLAFSPDGYRLVSASQDDTVRVWDAREPTAELALEREAAGLVEFLFAQPLGKQEVLGAIRNHPTLGDEVRRTALGFAERAWDDPDRFDSASWAVVRRPGAAPERYRQALQWAKEACRLEPDHGDYLTTLGVAQYRVGEYRQALATLSRAEQLKTLPPWGLKPVDLAFLAMTRFQLGQAEEARATLDGLRKVVSSRLEDDAADARAFLFLREAEELLGGPQRK